MPSTAANQPFANLAREDSDDPWAALAGGYYPGWGDVGAAIPLTSPPYSAQWTTTNGAWETAANWTVTDPGEPAHSVPGADDAVSIANNGSTGYAIIYNTTDTIWSIRSGTAVTLALQSGALIVRHGGVVAGILDVDAGAALAVDDGELFVADGDFAGNLSGGGALEFNGAVTLAPAAVTVATLVLGGGASVTTLGSSVSYGGNFEVEFANGAAATLSLNGKTFSLSGTATVNGAINGLGTVNLRGDATLLGHFQVKGGARFAALAGATIMQRGRALLGQSASSTGSLIIDSGAAYDVAASALLGDPTDPANAIFSNSGAMTVANDAVLTVDATFANHAGATLTVGAGGVFYLAKGAANLNGTIAGDGELKINTDATAVLSASALEIAEVAINGGSGGGKASLATDISYGGEFVFNTQYGQLDLNGKTLTLTGQSSAFLAANFRESLGAVSDGTLTVTGAVPQFGGTFLNDVINDEGTLDETGNVVLPGTTLNIGVGDVYQFVGHGSGIFGGDLTYFGASSEIVNAGTFSDATSGGDVIVDVYLLSTGTLSVAADDTMILAGGGDLGGAISGAGNLSMQLYGAQINTSNVTVAALNLSPALFFGTDILNVNLNYSGAFDLSGYESVAVFELAQGVTLNLSGDHNLLSVGTISGPGALEVSGAATFSTLYSQYALLAIEAPVLDAGAITQIGEVLLFNTLTIASGHTYTIAKTGDLVGNGSMVVNVGEFIENSGSGTTRVSGGFTNDGEIIVESGRLVLRTAVIGVGTEEIDAGGYLQLNWESTASQRIVFAGDNAELGLAAPSQFNSDIDNFGAATGQAIDLIGLDSNTAMTFASVSGGIIVNLEDGGVNHASLHLVGSYNQSGFHLDAGGNGELLTYSG